MLKIKKTKSKVGRKLYLMVLTVFLVFAVSFIMFQQTREKQYKISTLTMKLELSLIHISEPTRPY